MRLVFISFLVFLLPNVAINLLTHIFVFDRAVINLDYVIPALLLLFRPAWWVFTTIFMVIYVIDLFTAMAPGFHFSMSSLLESLPYLTGIISAYTLSVAVLVLTAGTGLSVLFLYASKNEIASPRKKMVGAAVLLIISAGAFAADKALVFPTLAEHFNVATSASQRIAQEVLSPASAKTRPQKMRSASEGWLRALGSPGTATGMPNTLYLFIVESWGEIKSNKLMQQRFELFQTPYLSRNFEVETILTPFAGSTVPAELRELCGVRYLSLHPDVDQLEKAACLPLLAKTEGYTTHALHNYRSSFFMRFSLYPKLGFDQAHFMHEMRERLSQTSYCGKTFRNLCDEHVPRYIRQISQTNAAKKNLYYWLTISSHVPPEPLSPDIEATYCAMPILQQARDLCALEYRVEKSLTHIATFLTERAAEGENYAAIVVGDHAPPFLRLSLRELYSSSHVPAVIITPKNPNHIPMR